MTKLQELRIWNNKISDMSPLAGLTNLKTLWILNGNPLSEESMNTYIPQLKARGVQVM
jgi:Leucine-rich repeat (LRR) protein